MAFLTSAPLEAAGIGLQGQMQLFRAAGNRDTELRAEGSEKADNRAVWLKSRENRDCGERVLLPGPSALTTGTQS